MTSQYHLKCLVAVVFSVLLLSGCGDGSIASTDVRFDIGYEDVGEQAWDAERSDASPKDADPSGDIDNTEHSDVEYSDAELIDTGLEDAAETDGSIDQPDAQEPTPDASLEPKLFVVWMAADGVDTRDGSTPGKAVLTLKRVQEILKASKPKADVEVRIAPGRYRGQKVNWTFSVPDHTVTLTRHANDSGRPIFDGCVSDQNCPGGTWFILSRSDGARTGIVFNYLRVENYQTAISLNGSRDAEAKSNSSNKIFGCYFNRIGNVFNPSVKPSTAAVRLVNSDDNEIINNHFVDIINVTSPGLLHAIYIAHMSDRNQILRNRFENNAGDPIRVRDYSNDNVINNNTFKKVAIDAAYSEWYCDHDTRNDCTKPTPECPSWGNQFRDNSLNGNYACQKLGTFKYYQDDSTTGCSKPSAQARRLSTSGNTSAASPCE